MVGGGDHGEPAHIPGDSACFFFLVDPSCDSKCQKVSTTICLSPLGPPSESSKELEILGH